MLLNGIFRSVWQIKIQDITQKNDFAYCLHVRGFLNLKKNVYWCIVEETRVETSFTTVL